MKLSKRLDFLASKTAGFKSLADICCDHGYLGIASVLNYGVCEVLLTDINEEPLNQAIKNVKNYHLEDKITCKLGDGLKPLDKAYEVINISGIGGMLMVKILSEGLDKLAKAKQIILSSNSDLPAVREFLMKNHFLITSETILFDYKYYEIIICKKVNEEVNYTQTELNFGPLLLKEKSLEFKDFYKRKLALYEKQIKGVKNAQSFELLSKKIKQIKEILEN